MKIFLCTSKTFYRDISIIVDDLKSLGFEVILPNSYENPERENEVRDAGAIQHAEWKSKMIRLQAQKVADADALLVINFTKNGMENYIGGAVLLEMYEAFRLGKKIFLWNPVPENMLQDEIKGLKPVVINGNIKKIVIS